MNDTLEVRDDLIRVRDGYLSELVDLARDRKKAEGLLNKLRSIERTIQAVAPLTSSKYVHHKTPVLAITDYLREIDRPATVKEIEDALCEGGFRGGDDDARSNIRRSISAYVSGLGRKTKVLKMVNDLVGLGEWENKRFK